MLLACKNIETLHYAKLMVEQHPVINEGDFEQYRVALYSVLDLKPRSSQQHHLQHEVILLLLESQFDPTAFDYLNRAENNNFSQDIISKLFEKGCVPSVNKRSRSIFLYNVTAPYRMKAYLLNTTRNPAGQTLLQSLMERSNNKIDSSILELLRYGADHKEFSPKPLIHIVIENITPLTIGAVKVLINKPDFDVDARNEENESVLQVLAKNLNKNNIEIFCTLINAGADITLLDKNNQGEILHSIIDYAGKITRTNEIVLDGLDEVYAKYHDRLPRYARKALIVVKKHGFDFNDTDKDGLNLLQKIMKDEPQYFSIDAALFLIEQGVNPTVTVSGKTVMHCYADSESGLFYNKKAGELNQYRFKLIEDQKLFSQNFELLIDACAKASPENIMLKKSHIDNRTAAEYFVNRHLATSSRFDNPRARTLVYLHIYQLVETGQYPAENNILENFRANLQIADNQEKDKKIFRDEAARAIVDYVTKVKDESSYEEDSEQPIAHSKEILQTAINQGLFNEHGRVGAFFTKAKLRTDTGCKKTFADLLEIINKLEPVAYTRTTFELTSS